MKKILLMFVITAYYSLQTTVSFAQQGTSISDHSGVQPDNSAILDVNSTSKGLLIPRVALVSTDDVTTIPNPATSLLIYNTGTGGMSQAGFYYWNGSHWIQAIGPTGLGYCCLTSSTSLTLTTGTQTLTTNLLSTQTAFTSGDRVRLSVNGSVTYYMEGVVSSFSSATMVTVIDNVANSGTYTSWLITIAGDKGGIGNYATQPLQTTFATTPINSFTTNGYTSLYGTFAINGVSQTNKILGTDGSSYVTSYPQYTTSGLPSSFSVGTLNPQSITGTGVTDQALFNSMPYTVKITNVNMNSTADQSVFVNAAKFKIVDVTITNASTDLHASNARTGLYSAVSGGGGKEIVSSQQMTTLSSATTAYTCTLTNASSYIYGTSGNNGSGYLYWHCNGVHGSAATADVYITIYTLY
jgi:hypothetical protein